MRDNTIAAGVGAAPAASAGAPSVSQASSNNTTFAVILSLSFCHLLNDMMQSQVPALYPILKDSHGLSFGQIGLITLAFQCTASMLQPLVGLYTDRKPQPYSLTVGMGFTLVGLLLMSQASSYALILLSAALIGMGSSVFHPEASRVARMAAGGRYGLAQSLFQVGGNMGSAAGPLLAAFIVVPQVQRSIVWFSGAALLAMAVLFQVGGWYRRSRARHHSAAHAPAATAVNASAGGAVGDRVGRIPVLWFSIVGALPFALLLPYANLFWTGVLSVTVAMIMASAFSAILVYAQELLPGRVGLVAGVFFGLSFGLGGLGAAALGQLADLTSIETVYRVTPLLLLLGLLTAFLPRQPGEARRRH